MFMMTLPKSVKVGDTVDCKINGEAARLTYRDAKTLVIESDDPRSIAQARERPGGLRLVICGDADGSSDFAVFGERPGGLRLLICDAGGITVNAPIIDA